MEDEFLLTDIRIEYFGANGPENGTQWPPSVDYKDISSNEGEAVGRLTDLIVGCYCAARVYCFSPVRYLPFAVRLETQGPRIRNLSADGVSRAD